MKINLKQTLKDYEGKDILEKDNKPTILKKILVMALNNYTNEEKPTKEDQNRAFGLSVSFYAREEVDLSVEDRAFIKDRVHKIFPSPLINGRVAELFEEVKEEKK